MNIQTLTDGREVIVYPFPLSTGQVATIELPNEPLTKEDAKRLAHFLRTLVAAGEFREDEE